ncbi:DgyrCDS9775 [Dimorphilus gyrociliatus]|uniref:Arginine-hydroxylase NDUFAF5, mitochondrial n=1 Tax=Dimorphilus gyrociliatus TaxID=2664684 RepID=A0A7I8VZ96_9ANNE|nr:DgyrCDS9775 [Dimorphilus gyrociliatus]
MNVFDRQTKRTQRNRTAHIKDYQVYDYIKEEIGYRVADRICDIKRKFNVAVDLGCGRGHVSKHILGDTVGTLLQTDLAEDILRQAEISPEVPTYKIHMDEEFLPFPSQSLDLVVSSLSLHWVNDLPGTFKQIYSSLKNDGCLLGALFGGDTLFELRVALQLAETERLGGFAPHVSPFTDVRDMGNLLSRGGFVMLTIDIDEIVINYPSMFELIEDLRGMGETNCAWSRKPKLFRSTLEAASAIYKDMYGNEDGSIPATFQILNFIGWKPDKSQAKPAKRGSGQVSLKDIDKLDSIKSQIDNIKNITGSDDKSALHLEEQLTKLRQATIEDGHGNKKN